VQWLDGDGVGVDVVAATVLWMVPPLQRSPRSVWVRICGEHCSTTNIGLRAPAIPPIYLEPREAGPTSIYR
jgi:hypothetical protein